MDNRRLFRVLMFASVNAAWVLSMGVVHDSVPLLAIGAAASAVCPWGVAAWWLIQRRRARP